MTARRIHCSSQRARLEGTDEDRAKAASHQLDRAIDELRHYREGRLNVDRLNALTGQCEAAPSGAARHHAITERLVQAVLDAHARWAEPAA